MTTYKGIIHVVHPLHHIYRGDNMHLNRTRLNAKFNTDHLLANTKSLEGNTGAWIYNTVSFAVVY